MQNQQTSQRIFSTFYQTLKAVDLFGQEFYLPVNKNKRYSTGFGITLSLCILLSILTYGIYKFQIFIAMESYQMVTSTLAKEINYTHPEVENFYDLGFDFAFKLTGDDLTPEMGSLKLSVIDQAQVLNTSSGSTYLTKEEKEMELVLCGEDGFTYHDKEEMAKKGIPSYYCLQNKTEMLVGGTFLTSRYRLIEIKLYNCVNSSESNITCASEEQQHEYFKSRPVLTRFVNSYIDPSDNKQMVKRYIDDKAYFTPILDQKSLNSISLRKSKAVTSPRFPWEKSQEQYYSEVQTIRNKQTLIGYQNQAMVQVSFEFDFFTTLVQKNQYTLFEFFSEIGGLFNSFLLCGRVLAMIFVTNSYLAYVTSNLYFVSNGINFAGQDGNSANLQFDNHEDIAFKTMQAMEGKQKFSMSILATLRYYFCCMSLRKQNSIQKSLKDSQFQQAKEDFYKNFDLIDTLKTLQELKALKNKLLSPLEQILLENQQEFTLQQRFHQQQSTRSNTLCNLDPIKRQQVLYQLQLDLYRAIDRNQLSEVGLRILKGVIGIEDQSQQNMGKNKHFFGKVKSSRRKLLKQNSSKEESDSKNPIFEEPMVPPDPEKLKRELKMLREANLAFKSKSLKKNNQEVTKRRHLPKL